MSEEIKRKTIEYIALRRMSILDTLKSGLSA